MTPKRAPGGRPLRRRVATRAIRKTLLIFCEGERTEPEYLNALKLERAIREVAAVEIRVAQADSGAVPLTLVKRAIEARSRAVSENDEVDEFWCVFDVEWPVNHAHLPEARALAEANKINLAVSNPCFEAWLILHLKEHGAWLDNDQAMKLRRKLDSSTDKGLDPAKYMPHVHEASDRAVKLEERHQRNGTSFPHNNPSSGMHRLIASVQPTDRVISSAAPARAASPGGRRARW
ncbi:MAG: RloB family protein [Trebonia sp.]